MPHLLISLVPLILIAAALILCVYVFVSLKKEIHSLRRRLEKNEQGQQAALQGIQGELDSVRQDVRDVDEKAGAMVAPTPPRSGLNLNTRSQALRMYRRGEVSENIAAALGLPRREVDLLLKVQKIVIKSSDTPTS